MSPRQKVSLSELKVGIFVVIACAVLAVAILAIGSRVGLFEDQFHAMTYLSNISGLKPGDVVLLGGVEVGNVTTVEISKAGEPPPTLQNQRIRERVSGISEEMGTLTAELQETQRKLEAAQLEFEQVSERAGTASPQAKALGETQSRLKESLASLRTRIIDREDDRARALAGLQNIRVEMNINSEYRDWIRADSNISLGSIGLLGDKYIEISLGRTDTPAKTVRGAVEGWFGSKTIEIVLVTGVQQPSFGELITGANDILANFETLSSQVHDIMRSFEAGEGSIGKLIRDPGFYNSLNNTVENANRAMEHTAEMMEAISRGKGTISKLIQDDEAYRRLVATTDHLESILRKIDGGDGTLGRFINDPSVYQESDNLIGNLKSITGRIDEGKGTLGRLSTDDKLYVSLQESIEELTALLQGVRDGKGTLGRLATDEELYANLNHLSSEMVKLLYDFRQNPKEFLTIKFELF